jgi:simple sugar transport system ATP-binding protein
VSGATAAGGSSEGPAPHGAGPAGAPVLELRGISKRYGAVVANDAVDLDLRQGEIHALLGENGAGKSTLMSILYGHVRPDAGEIVLGGEVVELRSPHDAIARGVGMVHQHFMQVPVMTVAENVVLGAEPRRGIMRDREAARKIVLELSERHGLTVDPDATMEDVTVGMQQRTEVLRALYRGARILVLDEPTAVLTAQEAEELMTILRRLRDGGTSIVLISHKLREVLGVADRVTVIRQGRKVATLDAAGATAPELARMMVGRDLPDAVTKAPREAGDAALEVRGLSVRDDRGLLAVDDASLVVRAGEIVALAGVDGNGQRELVQAICGLRTPESGAVLVEGAEITGTGVAGATDAGVGHIPEDRRRDGLVLDFTIAENLALRRLRSPEVTRRGLLRRRRMRDQAEELIEAFDVRGGGPGTPARSLSGGNQQKVSIARELACDPRVLVAAQPTRGLDVGAIDAVHRRLVAERDAGRAVLLVSLDLDEVRAIADRVLVIYAGRIVAELPPTATAVQLGAAMSSGAQGAAA